MAALVQIVPGFIPQPSEEGARPLREEREFARELMARMAPPTGTAPARTVVPSQRTHLTGNEAASALSSAYQKVMGQPPTGKQLSVLVAQWSHETGGGRAMMNFNFGGIKGTGPSGLSAAYKTTEGSGESERKLVDHFRAYRNPEEGATDYVQFLKDRFPQALESAKQGDSAGFVHALKRQGYFTGSEEAYVKSVTALSDKGRTEGFAAVGRERAPGEGAPAVTSAPSFPYGGAGVGDFHDDAMVQQMMSALLHGGHAAESQQAVDALSMNDEISRAALRIAGSS